MTQHGFEMKQFTNVLKEVLEKTEAEAKAAGKDTIMENSFGLEITGNDINTVTSILQHFVFSLCR